MVQVIRKKTPYRIEKLGLQCLKFGFTFWIWASTIPRKNILGDYFTEGGWISILKEQPCTKLIR